jgi:hypothetical protein
VCRYFDSLPVRVEENNTAVVYEGFNFIEFDIRLVSVDRWAVTQNWLSALVTLLC